MLQRVPQSAMKRKKVSDEMSFAGPTKGLMLFDDISRIPDGGAVELNNFVVTNSVARARLGSTIRNESIPGGVRDIATYISGSQSSAFSFGNAIYDVSSFGAVGAPLVGGLAAADWSFLQFATTGGVFLVACSTGNSRYLYDGSSWATTPAITGLLATKMKQTWLHAGREWFIEDNSLNAWYLPSDSISGSATKFPLQGQFRKGGVLVAGASWTIDAGDVGPQSSCIFITSEGEVAVYVGNDPAANFEIKGVYAIGRPLGINCFMKAGGDVAVMTDDGLVAMSQVVSLDAAALANKSVSKNIRPLWLSYVKSTDKSKWRIVRHDAEGYAVVSVPSTSGQGAVQFVANLQTGAWSTWSGWDIATITTFKNELIFADTNGDIFTGESGGSDNGISYTMLYVGPFREKRGASIHAKLMRAVARSTNKFTARLSAIFDYSLRYPNAPQSIVPDGGSLWDTALWDTALWGGEKQTYQNWRSVSGIGTAVAPCVQFTLGATAAQDVELIRTDLVFEIGTPIT